MDVERTLTALTGKDTKQAYGMLLELERLSEASDCLYPEARRFADMVRSSRYAVRVRGFRLLCKQARWDGSGTLDWELEEALSILQDLQDEKPTAVRQALAALK